MRIAEQQIYVDRNGAKHQLREVLPGLSQVLLRAQDGYTSTESISQFTLKVAQGELTLLRDSAADGVPAIEVPAHTRLDPRQQEQHAHRKRIVDRVRALQREGKTWAEIEHAIAAGWNTDRAAPPNKRTLQRWTERSATPNRLAPGRPGWRRGRSRIPTAVLKALNDAMNFAESHDMRERLTLKSLQGQALRMLAKGNNAQHRAISLKTVKRFVEQRDTWESGLRATLDRRTLRAITRVARAVVDAVRPLELVEIDALIPELHVFAPDGTDLGQPTIYAAIDVATRHVLAIRAYLLAPGTEPLMDFCERAFFPKPKWHDGRMLPWGVPERVVSDQGPEFQSSFWANAADKLGFEAVFAEGEAGWRKPHIERFFGSLKTRLLHRFPGTTWSAARRLVDPALAERSGGLTLEELNDQLERFAYDIDAKFVSKRLSLKHEKPDMTPERAWDALSKWYPPTVPVSRDEYRSTTFEFLSQGKLDHAGVRIEHLEYSSDALAALYRETGPAQVDIYGTPLDVGVVFVKHVSSGQVVEAKAKREVVHDITRRTWRSMFKKLGFGRRSPSDQEIEVALAEMITQAAVTTKKVKQRQAKRQRRDLVSQAMAADKQTTKRTSTETPIHHQIEATWRLASGGAHAQPRTTRIESLDDIGPLSREGKDTPNNRET